MGAIRKYNPEERIITYCRRVHAEVAGNDNDTRLSEAQRYAGVIAVLKCDPAILCARVIDLCMDRRSKWEVPVGQLHRMIVDLHNMISASPDYRTRKPDASDNQFELDFAWQVVGDTRVAGLEAGE
jgi:hypothetical protein